MSNFIIDCIRGTAVMSDIDDYIDAWHESDSTLSMHDYLGMSIKEYALFVDDENYLGSIITAHKTAKTIELVIKDQFAMAARSDDPAKSAQLERWLKNEGLWE